MVKAHKALEAAIKQAGSQSALARHLGLAPGFVWAWLNKSKKGTPPEYVLKIEKITGVSRHDLRPDIYPKEEKANA